MLDPGIPSAAMLRIVDLPRADRETVRQMWLAWYSEAMAAGMDRHEARAQATERLLACEFYGGMVVEYAAPGDGGDGSTRAGDHGARRLHESEV